MALYGLVLWKNMYPCESRSSLIIYVTILIQLSRVQPLSHNALSPHQVKHLETLWFFQHRHFSTSCSANSLTDTLVFHGLAHSCFRSGHWITDTCCGKLLVIRSLLQMRKSLLIVVKKSSRDHWSDDARSIQGIQINSYVHPLCVQNNHFT